MEREVLQIIAGVAWTPWSITDYSVYTWCDVDVYYQLSMCRALAQSITLFARGVIIYCLPKLFDHLGHSYQQDPTMSAAQKKKQNYLFGTFYSKNGYVYWLFCPLATAYRLQGSTRLCLVE